MRHHAAPDFRECCHALPAEVRRLADRAFELVKADSLHPSLYLKKAGRFWSARPGLHHRALAAEVPDGLLWFRIESHAEYDNLLA